MDDKELKCHWCESVITAKQKWSEIRLHKRPIDVSSFEKLYHTSMHKRILCSECIKIYCRSMPLYPHDYKPELTPIRGVKKESTIGIELELEIINGDVYKEQILHDVNQIMRQEGVSGLFYAKHDGSMRYGIEFVSLPMGISTWKEISIDKLFYTFSKLFTVKSTCGMHVHLDHSMVSYEDFLKLNGLFFANRMFFYLFGGRYHLNGIPSDYALRKNRYYSFVSNKAVSPDAYYKYLALAYREHTVEFRIFSSTVDYSTFMDNIVFCYHLPQFIKKYSTSTCSRSRLMSNRLIEYFHDNNLPSIEKRLKNALSLSLINNIVKTITKTA